MEFHEGEILTDNTKIKRGEQCVECVHWGTGPIAENRPEKACCRKYPDWKPVAILHGEQRCPYRKTGRNQDERIV